MAFPNNQRFNSPTGQQHCPGMGSPFAGSPMIPGQTVPPGATFGQPNVAQHSPMTVSLPGFIPIGHSSPITQITTPMPPVSQGLQGPHVRLFPPVVSNSQQPMPMTVPPVIPWGARAITGSSFPAVARTGFVPPQGNIQPGLFGPQPNLPPMQPQVPFSQSGPQNSSYSSSTGDQALANVQERNTRNYQEPNEERERFHYNRYKDRHRKEEWRDRYDKRDERSDHSDRSSDRSSYFERRGERDGHSNRRSDQHTGRHKREAHGRRDDRRHHLKERSRDESWGNETRDSSSDSSRQGYRKNRYSDHDHQRAGARHAGDLDAPSSKRLERSDDRHCDDPDSYGGQRVGKTGAVLLEDQDEYRSVGRSGAVLLEDRDTEGESRSTIGKTGAILKEDRDSERSVLRNDYGCDQHGREKGRTNSRRGFHGFHRGRGQRGSRSYHSSIDRSHSRDTSRERSHTRERSESRNRDRPSKRPRTEDYLKDLESSSDTTHEKGGNSEEDSKPPMSGLDQWTAEEDLKKMRVKEYIRMKEHSSYWDALKDAENEEENEQPLEEVPEETTAWVRCSAADLYYNKDLKTGCTFSTKKTQDLERRFENELVLCNERAREKIPETVKEELTKPHSHYLHFHDSDSDSSGSDSDDEVKNEIMEEWMAELKRKQEHPQRLHKEVWHNEPAMLNDGPLCRCSLKHRKTGIRHSVYPGEKPIPACDPNSNNKDKLYHYRISMSPTTNILSKTPSLISHDNHEYMFEGFSIFTHSKLSEKMPLCKLLRFSILYTIYTIDETFPENFTVRSLDLFTRYLFTEVLELLDIEWKGPGDETSCQRFHVMPRFARPLPENGKEILSMNEVLLFLLKSREPLLDPIKLPQLLKLNRLEWTNFVDEFRGMIITSPGMKPTSLRLDQLDKSHCEDHDGGSVSYPVIVHCGVRPAQLSYCGDPEYKKKWREFMKLRHLYTNRPKMTQAEKEKLDEAGEELVNMRIKSSKKRDVTVEISSEGFYRTGIRTDVCQHALLLPVLFDHLRFHDCLHLFEEQIGYTFKDRYLLQLAFTHASYKVNFGTNPDHVRNSLSNCGNRIVEMGDIRNNFKHTKKKGLTTLIKIMSTFGYKHEQKSEVPHNERLEFLGDAVIEFLSSIHLFFMFPYHDEGEMTTYRGSLVQNKNLTDLARKIHLEDYMLFAHGPDLCEELTMKHAMANCFEALMGAMMLDSGMLSGGLEEADKVFSRCLFDEPVLLDVWNGTTEHPLQLEEPNGDRHWIESSPALQRLLEFEERLGLTFRHIRLLARSFCQRSVGYNNLTYGNNQRLEFLGDTIIQLITSEYLYKHFPAHHEGHLTLLRSSLVNNRTQATVCEELGMTEFVITDDNHLDTRLPVHHLRTKHKADLLEALLGALYVDGGLEFPKALIEVCFFPRLEEFILNHNWNDPKSQLQQCCLVLRDPDDGDPDVPIYKIVNVTGPSNTRCYTVAVYFQGQRLATGSHYTIQNAEMEAAAKALIAHKERFLLPLFDNSPWFGRLGRQSKPEGARGSKDYSKKSSAKLRKK